MYYNYFRYYDPSIGRYVTSDPIGLDGGLNTYGYVNGNPLKSVDYFGLAIGDFPPPPPGYNRSTWSHGTFDNGRHYLTEPNKGRTYIIHPEDKGHWRHWDVYPPDDNDGNSSGGKKRLPENSKKGWPNQKKFKPDQCPVDPNGDAEPWEPTDEQRAWEDFYNGGPFPYFTPNPRYFTPRFPRPIFRTPIFAP